MPWRIESFNIFIERSDNERFLEKPNTSSSSTNTTSRGHTPGLPTTFEQSFLQSRLGVRGHRPKRLRRGWVVGSDPKKCDVLVGSREKGVSGEHFAIKLHKRPGALIVIPLSRHGTLGREANERFLHPIENDVVLKHSAENPFGRMDIEIANIHMKLQCSELPSNRKEFEAAWHSHYAEYLYESQTCLLSLDNLDIAPPPCSTQAPVGRYIMNEPMRECSTGRFYAAQPRKRRRRDDKVVMVKRYSQKKYADHEVYTLCRVKQAHIIQFIDYVEHPEQPELVMQYVDGPSLVEARSDQPFNMLELKRIGKQSAEALSHLHGLSLVHGDVCLENILLLSREPIHVKLFNFCIGGVARHPAPEYTEGGRHTDKMDI